MSQDDQYVFYYRNGHILRFKKGLVFQYKQNYKKVTGDIKQQFQVNAVESMKSINTFKVSGYENVYVSNNAKIKPKRLQEINKLTNNLYDKYKIQDKSAKIVIVDASEINYAFLGKYDAVKNTIYYPSKVDDYTIKHEMWHCKQADMYKQRIGNITKDNYDDYLQDTCRKAKVRLEGLGITKYNVNRISKYATLMFKEHRFDEVEAEYRALKGE